MNSAFHPRQERAIRATRKLEERDRTWHIKGGLREYGVSMMWNQLVHLCSLNVVEGSVWCLVVVWIIVRLYAIPERIDSKHEFDDDYPRISSSLWKYSILFPDVKLPSIAIWKKFTVRSRRAAEPMLHFGRSGRLLDLYSRWSFQDFNI